MFDREEIARAAALRAAWEAGELRAFLDRQPESRAGVPDALRPAAQAGLHRRRRQGPPPGRSRPAGPVPVHARAVSDHVPRAALDHAPDRGLRHGRGHQRPLPLPHRAGPDGAQRGLRHADPHGLRLRRPALAWARSGARASPWTRSTTSRPSSTGVDLETISVSMTINPTAWILLAMYVALAQSRGCDLNRLSGTVQADILKEYIAQKEWIFPIRPSMRIMRDMIVWSARNMARYNPINISGYHISEAGATSVQEVAFTMANAIAYVEEVTRAGVRVDEFAPRLAFYFVAQNDFFEEIAKFRAARRIYAQHHEGALRRDQGRVHAAALPLPDGGRDPDPRPADEQRRPHGAPGALRGARRGAVAPHQRARRGLRHPLRGGDEAGAPHPADHRRGEPRGRRDRPPRRLVLRRGADQRDRAPRLRDPRQGGRARRHHQGRRGRLLPA